MCSMQFVSSLFSSIISYYFSYNKSITLQQYWYYWKNLLLWIPMVYNQPTNQPKLALHFFLIKLSNTTVLSTFTIVPAWNMTCKNMSQMSIVGDLHSRRMTYTILMNNPLKRHIHPRSTLFWLFWQWYGWNSQIFENKLVISSQYSIQTNFAIRNL